MEKENEGFLIRITRERALEILEAADTKNGMPGGDLSFFYPLIRDSFPDLREQIEAALSAKAPLDKMTGNPQPVNIDNYPFVFEGGHSKETIHRQPQYVGDVESICTKISGNEKGTWSQDGVLHWGEEMGVKE